MQIDGTITAAVTPSLEQGNATFGNRSARAADVTSPAGTSTGPSAKTGEYALIGTSIEQALRGARGDQVSKSFAQEFVKQAQAGEEPSVAAKNALAEIQTKGLISPQEAQALQTMIRRLDELPPQEKKAQAQVALESLMEESEAAPSYLRQLLDDGASSAAPGGAASAAGAAPAAPAGKAAVGGGPASPKGPTAFISAPKGFLWKPNSDSTGKLAILLPPGMSGRVASLRVVGASGNVIENGKSAGIGNGGREHFRFDKSGQEFPPGSKVEITLKTGQTVSYTVGNPAIRNEGRG